MARSILTASIRVVKKNTLNCAKHENNPSLDGKWVPYTLDFPFDEIKEIGNDKDYRYLYDYEVYKYEKMTKDWLGRLVKEYELLLLFGGKISKNPSDPSAKASDIKVSRTWDLTVLISKKFLLRIFGSS